MADSEREKGKDKRASAIFESDRFLARVSENLTPVDTAASRVTGERRGFMRVL